MSDLIKMCSTVVSHLFKKTACEMYPVKPARFYENSRGSVQLDPPKCILCTLCEKRCPTGAIKVDRDKGTWEINRTKCIICNECVSCCRPVALKMDNQYNAPAAEKQIDKINVPKKEKKAKPVVKKAATEKKEAAPKKAEAPKKVEKKKE